MASDRDSLNADSFVEAMGALGVSAPTATYLWDKLEPYYIRPLTPYPSDRIFADMRIDPDDISDIVVDYEKAMGGWLGENYDSFPSDPTIAELGVTLEQAAK